MERKEAMEPKSWEVLPMRVEISASTAPRAPTESFPRAISRMAKMFAAATAKSATRPLARPRKNTFRWLRFSFTTYSSARAFHLAKKKSNRLKAFTSFAEVPSMISW